MCAYECDRFFILTCGNHRLADGEANVWSGVCHWVTALCYVNDSRVLSGWANSPSNRFD